MDVADDALAGWYRPRELMPDGMARFVFWNGRVHLRTTATVAEMSVGARVYGRTIVGVHHMAGRAAAIAVIARMIVSAGQRQDGIEEARLLQSEKHGVG